MDPPELRRRTSAFAREVLALSKPLLKRAETHDIALQLRRAVTRTAANYRAACRAKSHRDFTSKIATVLEEADESQHWLETLRDCEFLKARDLAGQLQEAGELVAIFTAAHQTAKRNDESGTG
jgi:four helix bundle protein